MLDLSVRSFVLPFLTFPLAPLIAHQHEVYPTMIHAVIFDSSTLSLMLSSLQQNLTTQDGLCGPSAAVQSIMCLHTSITLNLLFPLSPLLA